MDHDDHRSSPSPPGPDVARGVQAAARPFTADDLAVVIPTHGRPDVLQRTVDALMAQTSPGFEIIVVVDGTDQPRPDDPRVRTLVQDHAGPGVARNLGVASTDCPLVLFLGDDMVPDPTLVERHIERHNESPEPEVAVLGEVVWHDEARGGRILRWMDWSRTQFDFGSGDEGEAGFGRFYSCNVSLKRGFFRSAGGFDPEFPYYYEDLDCAYRLAEHGMRLLHEPLARTRHLHDYTLAAVAKRFEGIATGEWALAQRRPEFEPHYLQRVRWAMRRPPVSKVWPRLVDSVPRAVPWVRGRVERLANTWYYQQLGPRYLDAWYRERDLEELREYLGEDYDEQLLFGHAAAVDEEEHAALDEETFYRTSRMYLYDLTAFAMAGTKQPYHVDLQRIVRPGSRLLDWGCGIGSDGLRFIDAGYRVSFADFDNPSTEYLRWRLERRGLDVDIVHDLDRGDVPGGFGLAYSFDVIEHVEDPFAFLAAMERRARLVMVNLLEPDPDDTHLHRPLPIGEILDHATARGLVHYRKYHGRSHLIVYRSAPSGAVRRLRGHLERRLGPTSSHIPLLARHRHR